MTKHWMVVVTASLAALLTLIAPAPIARADIFQWEYINPAKPHRGKQQSMTLCVGGAGVDATPGANLYDRNLTMAYLIGANLTGAHASATNLTNADLSQANLTNADFSASFYSSAAILTGATLTGANFTGAEVRGATFSRNSYYPFGGSGLTPAQLSSTASYLAHDLTGIILENNTLTGVNLAGQNLTNANFYGATLTGASFNQANLTGANIGGATLTNANLTQANLTNANFQFARLTGANLTGAEVRGAAFSRSYDNSPDTGITPSQLYSTASYVAHDLTGVKLTSNNLASVNLANQNLTNANFDSATLTGASFNQANLTGANFRNATLTGANLTGAEVRGAAFTSADYNGPNSGITPAQLYSTASYQAHDLTGIRLWGSFVGINLAGQNLTNASLGSASLANADLSQANLTGANFLFCDYYCGAAYLAGANLSQANLTNTNFAGFAYPIYDEYGEIIGTGVTPGADLTNANLSGADARGATFEYATLSGANTNNLIQSDGHLAGLDLTAGASLVVRDYDGNPAADPTPIGLLPIVVDGHLATDATGTLRLVFDADPWNSSISFAPSIAVSRGGTLELTFAPEVNLVGQLGRTIDLFDWTGVTPTGTFTVSSPYTWNLSNLYTTGEVTLTALAAIPGDFNINGVVDAADYVAWRKTGGTQVGYNTWRTHFGQSPGSGAGTSANTSVPEPATPVLLMLVAAGGFLQRGRAA